MASATASSVSVSVPIWLTLTRIELATPGVDAPAEPLDVGDEEVVADELHPVAERVGERGPAVPVVLGHAVLDRHDRVAVAEVDEAGDHLGRRRASGPRRRARTSPSAKNSVEATSRARAISSPGASPAALDRLDEHLDGLLVGAEVRGEAALVADGGRQAPLVQERLEVRGRSRRPSAAPRRTRPRRPA